MPELEWVRLHTKEGAVPPDAYVHGELFGVGGVKTTPDNPRGTRSNQLKTGASEKGTGTFTM